MAYRVTLAPLPMMALLALRADEAARLAIAAALPTGLPAEPNSFAAAEGVTTAWLGPDEWLVAAPPAREDALLRLLEGVTRGRHACATRVSDQYAGFHLSGPQCRDVLAQSCSLDLRPARLPVGGSARTLMADVTVLLLRRDDCDFDLLVDRSLGRHLEDWLAHAAGLHRLPDPGASRPT